MPETQPQRSSSVVRAELLAEREALGADFDKLGDDLAEAGREAREKSIKTGKKAAKYGGAAGGALGALAALRALIRRRRRP